MSQEQQSRTIEDAVVDTVDNVLLRAVTAIEEAVNQHGGEAVELAMFAVRVQAFQNVMGPLFVLILSIVGSTYLWRHCRTKDMITHGWFVDGRVDGVRVQTIGESFVLVIAFAASFVFSAFALVSLVKGLALNILAIAGYPEVVVATNILKDLDIIR